MNKKLSKESLNVTQEKIEQLKKIPRNCQRKQSRFRKIKTYIR